MPTLLGAFPPLPPASGAGYWRVHSVRERREHHGITRLDHTFDLQKCWSKIFFEKIFFNQKYFSIFFGKLKNQKKSTDFFPKISKVGLSKIFRPSENFPKKSENRKKFSVEKYFFRKKFSTKFFSDQKYGPTALFLHVGGVRAPGGRANILLRVPGGAGETHPKPWAFLQIRWPRTGFPYQPRCGDPSRTPPFCLRKSPKIQKTRKSVPSKPKVMLW